MNSKTKQSIIESYNFNIGVAIALIFKKKKTDINLEAINGITDFQLLEDTQDEPTAKPIFRMEYEGKEIRDEE